MLNGERVLLRPVERAGGGLRGRGAGVLGTVPTSVARYEARFDRESADPPKGVVWFAVEAQGELIGECGLHEVDHFNRRCELGIALGREHWGKGFGQDAVRTLVDYAFTHLNMNRVALRCLADDPCAVGAYRKAGFVDEGRLRQMSWVSGEFHDELVMSILRGGQRDT